MDHNKESAYVEMVSWLPCLILVVRLSIMFRVNIYKLAHSTLPENTREGALAMYNTWLRNHSDAFWASRLAML